MTHACPGRDPMPQGMLARIMAALRREPLTPLSVVERAPETWVAYVSDGTGKTRGVMARYTVCREWSGEFYEDYEDRVPARRDGAEHMEKVHGVKP